MAQFMGTFNEAGAAEDVRLDGAVRWLGSVLPVTVAMPVPVAGDASFRRYFRVRAGPRSFVLMDAPPDREPLQPFVRVAGWLRGFGMRAPHVHACDPELGYALLEDFGDTSYLDAVGRQPSQTTTLYRDALSSLLRLAVAGRAHQHELPPYDLALLEREIDLFPEWLLERHLGLTLSAAERAVFDALRVTLCTRALEQPRVFVHRDFHSRNLMVVDGEGPGVLDFQDAVEGPVTYDLVSLLKDCYLRLPEDAVTAWVAAHRDALADAGVDVPPPARFIEDFHWMGVQRHLKAAGIFARLWHRDGKPGYLGDVPRTLGYIIAAAGVLPALAPFADFIHARVLPALGRADPRQ